MADGGLGARGLTEQQRRFADLILSGKTQIEAHKLAGYKGKNDQARAASASEILRNPNVAAYVNEHRQEASSKASVTLAWLIEQAQEVLAAARADSSHAASIAAIKEIGVLSGERVEKRENTNRDVNDTSELSREELLGIARAGRQGTAAPGPRVGNPDQLHKVH